MTPEERKLWQHLRRSRHDGLHWRRQQVIGGFIVDFYCHAAGLAVEVDGTVHDIQVEYDTERDFLLAARGVRIMRIRNDELRHDLDGVLARIAAQAGSNPTRVSPESRRPGDSRHASESVPPSL
jgi:very-short-patch-repair endonuclease